MSAVGGRRRPTALSLAPWSGARPAPAIRVLVSVDRNHCHRYAVCQQEAPEVFELTGDGRLAYDPAPGGELLDQVRQAARLCPMQAITIREAGR